jgi:hypothetical protein
MQVIAVQKIIFTQGNIRGRLVITLANGDRFKLDLQINEFTAFSQLFDNEAVFYDLNSKSFFSRNRGFLSLEEEKIEEIKAEELIDTVTKK